MTDQEIIQGLIARDNRVTEEFFFVKCRPLFVSIMNQVFNYEVDYDEFVNELYVYLMEDDAQKLRNFHYRSTVYQWLKILAIRFFIKKRGRMIEDKSHETPYKGSPQNMVEYASDCHATANNPNDDYSAEGDLERLFNVMRTKRYVYVIRRLIIEDCKPEQLAQEMNITAANLYNIKRRAMAQLTLAAIDDINKYEKK